MLRQRHFLKSEPHSLATEEGVHLPKETPQKLVACFLVFVTVAGRGFTFRVFQLYVVLCDQSRSGHVGDFSVDRREQLQALPSESLFLHAIRKR